MTAPSAAAIRKYGVGLAAYGASLTLSFALYPAVPQAPGALLLAAMMLAAWWGGRGPGVLVTLLSAVSLEYLFLPPRFAWKATPATLAALAAYLLVALLIGSAADLARAARQRAEAARDEADRLNRQLRAALKAARLVAFSWDLRTDQVRYSGSAPRERSASMEALLEGVHPEDRPVVCERLAAARDTGEYESLHRRVTPDGILWIRERGRITFDPVGKPVRMDGIALDVTESERAAETARLLAAIVESSTDGIVGHTLDGTITAWNHGAERLYGYSAAEAVGRSLSFLMPPGSLEDVEDISERIARGERVDQYETVRLRRDGRTVEISLAVAPIRDGRGNIVGASEIARDISQARRLAQELRERSAQVQRQNEELAAQREELVDRNRALVEQDRFRNEFLAMLAHELRNPLAPIVVSTEILRQKSGSSPDVQRHLATIDRQARHLRRLIDDFLDAARITQGKIRLRPTRVELTSLVDEAVRASEHLVRQAGHRLVVELPRDPIELDADPDRLVQALCNLLGNAAKYTEPGGRIHLRVERERVGGQEAAAVRVLDTGRGIAPDLLPRIFDLFVQGERTLDRAEGGLGVGLSLVRAVAELHGGSVEARSAGPGHGSEFVLRLPLEPLPAATPAPPTRERPDSPAADRPRVLVVEDNPDAAATLGELLGLWGYEAVVAHDGRQGLEMARSLRPPIALLDIGLPGKSGYEMARELRSDPGSTGMLLVALTGYGSEADRQRALEAGFDCHFAKPLEPDELRRYLAEAEAAAPCA